MLPSHIPCRLESPGPIFSSCRAQEQEISSAGHLPILFYPLWRKHVLWSLLSLRVQNQGVSVGFGSVERSEDFELHQRGTLAAAMGLSKCLSRANLCCWSNMGECPQASHTTKPRGDTSQPIYHGLICVASQEQDKLATHKNFVPAYYWVLQL